MVERSDPYWIPPPPHSEGGYESDDDFWPTIEPEYLERYRKQVKESEGFDVDPFPGCYQRPDMIKPMEGYDDFYVKFLHPAIEQYNLQQKNKEDGGGGGGRLIEFERIIKINIRSIAPPHVYYTFEAKDVTDGTKRRTYQTLIAFVPGKAHPEIKIFREKGTSCED